MRDCGMCAIFHTCDITIFIFQVMAMGIALGVTVFATGVGAVAALAALGPIGPFVAIGVVVSKVLSICSVDHLHMGSSRLSVPSQPSVNWVFSSPTLLKPTVRLTTIQLGLILIITCY